MASSTLKTALMTSVYAGKTTKNYELSTKHGIGTGSAGALIDYVYFSNPVPAGATVTSAKLYLYTDAQTTGAATHTLTLKRLSKSVSMTKVTYATRPTTYYATPAAATASKVAPFANNSEWVLDVTPHLQAVANGDAWYGWELTGSSNPNRNVYGPRWTTAAQRPRLEVTWAMLPGTPSSLSPGGARLVGLPKPVLRATYTDIGADNPLAGLQVQRNDVSNDFSGAVTWDSGTVPATTAQLDTSLTTWPALTSSTPIYWRMRVQDVNGLWSLWSTPESFGYDAKASVELVNPGPVPYNYVNEDSPPITWNFPADGPEKLTNPYVTSLTYIDAQAGTGATAALTLVPAGAPTDPPTFARLTWSVAQTSAGNAGIRYGFATQDTGLSGITAGQVYDVLATVRSSIAQRVNVQVQWLDAASAVLGTITGPNVDLAAGVWTPLKYTATAAPANTVRARVMLYSGAAAPAVLWPVGSTLDASSFSFRLADTSETQAAYQVFLIDPVSGAQLWTSGKVTSSSTTGFSLPAGYLKTLGATYRVTVYVWDAKSREATPGDTVFAQASRDFTYALSTSVPPVTTLTAVADPVRPLVNLSWARSTFPDSFTILRNGVVIATELLPGDVSLTSTTFAYIDPAPLPNTAATYQVTAVVNGRSSSGNATATATVSTMGMWLADQQRTLELLIVGKESRSWTYGEQSEVLEVIGASQVVVVTHAQRGLEGSVSGQLRTGMLGLPQTAADWKAAALALKAKAGTGATLYLTAGDATIPVVVAHLNITPRAEPILAFDVSFDFYQVAA